ncbi:hypothetical protein [Rubrivirga sp. IMCC43871]|uniref:hypothetical protein n=1 Tax=Rubrivirga sp. IMCC43871 TaxID=3391575 RepID=UPI00398FB5BE
MRFPLRGLAGLLALMAAVPAPAQTLRASGPPVRLLADGAPALHPVWAPDGTRLAFTRDQYRGVWIVEADGSDARALTDAPAAGFGFEWAPDGQALVARVARTEGLRRFHTAALVRLDGTVEALTDERAQMPALPRWAGPHHVALLSDGTVEMLAVDAQARTVAAEPVLLARPTGGLAVADTGGLRALASFADATLLNVTPSPDGRRVAFEVLAGNLFVVDADGSNRIDLGRGSRPTWSPDGRWVAFMVTEDDGHAYTAADLVAARADGSARVALTQSPDRLEMNPSWSPDGRAIAFDDATDGALYLLPLAE